jgi:predicted RNA-binding Zn ribbon-like protein
VSGHLFVDFANSAQYDGRGNLLDRLDDPGWRRGFAEDWDLPDGELDDRGLRDLAAFRDVVRSVVDRTRAGRPPAPRDLAALDAALAACPVRHRLSGGGARPRLEVETLAGTPAAAIAGEVALSLARYLSEDDLGRLKMCDNAGCRWVFHDETRNRSRRWCRTCGNVDKVRRFRARRLAARGA